MAGAGELSSDDVGFAHRTERGELRIWLAAPTVMVFRYKGHSDAGYVDFLERIFHETFGARRRVHVFVDCEEQTGYDAAFRDRIVEWAKRIHPQTQTYCLLVRSRLVAFGISVANLLVGGHTTIVASRSAFRSRLEMAVRRSLADEAA